MEELADIKAAVEPENIFLVVDAMIGQDAVKIVEAASTSASASPASSSRSSTATRAAARRSASRRSPARPSASPAWARRTDKLEEFRADGMASRILGMGDVVGLMKDFEEVVDEKKADEDAMRMLEGEFTLDDFLEQIRMIQKMGSLKDLVEKMPGHGRHDPARREPRRQRARAHRGDHPVDDAVRAQATRTRSSASRRA